ncbi:MAG: HU family DNA-binding protein, partial [Candidatus Kapaibacterium sp.]
MNKGDLVESIAAGAALSKSQAEKALNATIESIASSLAKGNTVSLIGFGTFSVSQRGARKGKNPRTGETIKIAARKVAKFKAGKGLSDVV